jgi:hypothetical protein
MTEQEKLLNKYYNGETSLEEEMELRFQVQKKMEHSSEQDIFGYFESESRIPDNLEENIFSKLEIKQKKGKTFRMGLLSIASSAAVLLIALTVFLNSRDKRLAQMESDFFVMEQALFQISESIQPPMQEEMLVLWVDDDIEIIIN